MKRSKYGMPPPSNRVEFEHNIFLVIEDTMRKVESGNEDLIQNVAWATYPHLTKVKKLPNGRVDLTTINEMLRNQANMMEWMKYMPKTPFKKESDSS
jgi:hypothetical protein